MKKQQIEALLQTVAATHDQEVDCAGLLARMAELAELRNAGAAIPEALRLAEAIKDEPPDSRRDD